MHQGNCKFFRSFGLCAAHKCTTLHTGKKLDYKKTLEGRDSLVASMRAYHATDTGIDPQRGNVWNRSPTSAGVDFVCHLNSDATSFGWDVKLRSSPCSMRSIKHRL